MNQYSHGTLGLPDSQEHELAGARAEAERVFFLTFPVIKTLVCLHINFLHCVFVIVSPALEWETLALC